MKRNLLILPISLFIAACSNAPQPIANANSAAAPQRSDRLETVTAHTTENQSPLTSEQPAGGKTRWTQSGEPIDTSKFDADIAKANKTLRSKPDDDASKKALAEAYFKRGVALTDARQYASALGDYRRALTYDPDNAQAKEWIEQIISIYDGLDREYPPEGQEPPPLPFSQKRPR
jgi:tetratricopeptide (TPR) repeat protein